MHWKEMMPGCFGDRDKIFGGHPADEKRAREMLKAAIDEKATMVEITAEATRLLGTAGAGPEHIAEQLTRIKELKF